MKYRSFNTRILPPILKKRDSSDTLSSFSDRDIPWRKHKRNAVTISKYYHLNGMESHARRVGMCSKVIGFKYVSNESGECNLKLSSALFCRVRCCPICQWRRSLRWKAKARQALPDVLEDYPGYRWLFLTLTLKNCPIADLRETLTHINQSFRRLSQLSAFPGVGWIKSVEVTRGKDGSAHPHLHILMMVHPDSFSNNYLNKEEWVELWKKSLRVDYRPILDIRAIKPEKSPIGLLSEILKYQCKESDLVHDSEWFGEYVKQTHKTRCVSVGGVFRKYFRVLEQEPEDLIGGDNEDEDQDADDVIFFKWDYRRGDYIFWTPEPDSFWINDTS